MTAPAVGRSPSTSYGRIMLVAPLCVAVLAGSWLLWTRGDPARQGGYCANATREISGLLRTADAEVDLSRTILPDVQQIFASLRRLDVQRLQVRTPGAVRSEVLILARRVPILRRSRRASDPQANEAFARVAADYLERCRSDPPG